MGDKARLFKLRSAGFRGSTAALRPVGRQHKRANVLQADFELLLLLDCLQPLCDQMGAASIRKQYASFRGGSCYFFSV